MHAQSEFRSESTANLVVLYVVLYLVDVDAGAAVEATAGAAVSRGGAVVSVLAFPPGPAIDSRRRTGDSVEGASVGGPAVEGVVGAAVVVVVVVEVVTTAAPAMAAGRPSFLTGGLLTTWLPAGSDRKMGLSLLSLVATGAAAGVGVAASGWVVAACARWGLGRGTSTTGTDLMSGVRALDSSRIIRASSRSSAALAS